MKEIADEEIAPAHARSLEEMEKYICTNIRDILKTEEEEDRARQQG